MAPISKRRGSACRSSALELRAASASETAGRMRPQVRSRTHAMRVAKKEAPSAAAPSAPPPKAQSSSTPPKKASTPASAFALISSSSATRHRRSAPSASKRSKSALKQQPLPPSTPRNNPHHSSARPHVNAQIVLPQHSPTPMVNKQRLISKALAHLPHPKLTNPRQVSPSQPPNTQNAPPQNIVNIVPATPHLSSNVNKPHVPPPTPHPRSVGSDNPPSQQCAVKRKHESTNSNPSAKKKKKKKKKTLLLQTTKQHVMHTTKTPNHMSNNAAPMLSPPEKRRRLQPQQPHTPPATSIPVKTHNPESDDEVVIVSETIVRTPSKQAPKTPSSKTKSVNVPRRAHAQTTNVLPAVAQLSPQTEYEKEKLIREYALHVVERDPDTDQVKWVVCKFCPIYGCHNRDRPFIMAYPAPLDRVQLERHLKVEHGKHWTLFKNGSKEVKQALFYRKRMPREHVLHAHIAEQKIKRGQGKKSFTAPQRVAWRQRAIIKERWTKSSCKRKAVPVTELARDLGVDLSALHNNNNTVVTPRKSEAPQRPFILTRSQKKGTQPLRACKKNNAAKAPNDITSKQHERQAKIRATVSRSNTSLPQADLDESVDDTPIAQWPRSKQALKQQAVGGEPTLPSKKALKAMRKLQLAAGGSVNACGSDCNNPLGMSYAALQAARERRIRYQRRTEKRKGSV